MRFDGAGHMGKTIFFSTISWQMWLRSACGGESSKGKLVAAVPGELQQMLVPHRTVQVTILGAIKAQAILRGPKGFSGKRDENKERGTPHCRTLPV
jgi:hypothetical protein